MLLQKIKYIYSKVVVSATLFTVVELTATFTLLRLEHWRAFDDTIVSLLMQKAHFNILKNILSDVILLFIYSFTIRPTPNIISNYRHVIA